MNPTTITVQLPKFYLIVGKLVVSVLYSYYGIRIFYHNWQHYIVFILHLLVPALH